MFFNVLIYDNRPYIRLIKEYEEYEVLNYGKFHKN